MSIQSASMLVKLTVSCWDGFKKDRTVSAQADAAFHTAGNAGNYNKRLLDKSVLAPILRLCTKIRYDHKFYTIPWCYDGVDLLPSKLYFEYTQCMRTHKDSLDNEVGNLVQQYPIHKANQATKLGDMFNPEDYPRRDDLPRKFGVVFQFFPVPQEGHFVVDLETREASKIKNDLNQILVDAQNTAQGKVYERVIESLDHVYERLADPGNIFRDSMVTNFVALAQVLPGLNIFDDPKLAEAAQAIQSLTYIDADRMRTDPDAREVVAAKLFDITNKLRNR